MFKKFVYQGVELDKLMDMTHAEVVAMFRSNIRRRFKRGLSRWVCAAVRVCQCVWVQLQYRRACAAPAASTRRC